MIMRISNFTLTITQTALRNEEWTDPIIAAPLSNNGTITLRTGGGKLLEQLAKGDSFQIEAVVNLSNIYASSTSAGDTLIVRK